MTSTIRSGERCVMAVTIAEAHGMPITRAAMIVDYVIDYLRDRPSENPPVELHASRQVAAAIRQEREAAS